MKVLTVEVHNVLRCEDVRFDLDGHHLFLVGGDNGQGKSSALTALLMALCGRGGMDWPEIALKAGEDNGQVLVELGGDRPEDQLTLELSLKRSRSGAVVEKFRLLDSEGSPVSKPRELLARLYKNRAFDPLEFANQSPAEQRKHLMELCGLNFSSDEQQRAKLYADRTDVNRELKSSQAALDCMKFDDTAPDKEVSVEALMQELEAAEAANSERHFRQGRAEKLSREIGQHDDKIAAVDAEIKRLEELIATLKTNREEFVVTRATVVNQWIAANKELTDSRTVDVEPIKQKIRGAEAVNAAVRENRKVLEGRKKVRELRAESDGITAAMAKIDTDCQKRLEAVKWPVAGLSIDDKGVLLDGLPFEQICTSRRMLVSTEIGIARNPELRVMVARMGGNDLGEGLLQELTRFLQQHDAQLIMEVVTRGQEDESRCAVVMENGRTRDDG